MRRWMFVFISAVASFMMSSTTLAVAETEAIGTISQGGRIGSSIVGGKVYGQARLGVLHEAPSGDLSYQDGSLAGPENPSTPQSCLQLTYLEDGFLSYQTAKLEGLWYEQAKSQRTGEMRIDFTGPLSRNYDLKITLSCDLELNMYHSDSNSYKPMLFKADGPLNLKEERINPSQIVAKIYRLSDSLIRNQPPKLVISWNNPSVTGWDYGLHFERDDNPSISLPESAVPFWLGKRGSPRLGLLRAEPSRWRNFSMKTDFKVVITPSTETYSIWYPIVVEVKNRRFYSLQMPNETSPTLFDKIPLGVLPPTPTLTYTYKNSILTIKATTPKTKVPTQVKGFALVDLARTLEKSPYEKLFAPGASSVSYKVKRNVRVQIAVSSWNDVGFSAPSKWIDFTTK